MKILLIVGGDSTEREPSLMCGDYLKQLLEKRGHQVEIYDPISGFEKIKDYKNSVDVALIIMTEDGRAQKVLEEADIPYLGSDSRVSPFCLDKVKIKELLRKVGIKTPGWQVVDKDSIWNSDLFKEPFVLKPINGGSSADIVIHRTGDPKIEPIKSLLERYPEMLLEQLIPGHEVTVGIYDKEALPVIEIVPPPGQEFDFEHKYNGSSNELYPPVHISAETQKEAQKNALEIHNAAGCRHLSRVDMIIDDNNDIWVLEINTTPGMTEHSLYPKAVRAAGMDFSEALEKLLIKAKSEEN